MLDVIESLSAKNKNSNNKVDGCTVLLNWRLLDYFIFMEIMSQWILSAVLGLIVLRVIHH